MDVCGYNWDDTCSTYENYQKFYNPTSQIPPVGGHTANNASKNSPTTPTNTFSFATGKQGSKAVNLTTPPIKAAPKQFELLKNGNFKLPVSDYKSLVISKFNGYVYIHFWGPKGKHISFNIDELSTLFAHKDLIEKQIKTVQDN